MVLAPTHGAQVAQASTLAWIALISYLASASLLSSDHYIYRFFELQRIVTDLGAFGQLCTVSILFSSVIVQGMALYERIPLQVSLLIFPSFLTALTAVGLRTLPSKTIIIWSVMEVAVMMASALLTLVSAFFIKQIFAANDPLSASLDALPYFFALTAPIQLVIFIYFLFPKITFIPVLILYFFLVIGTFMACKMFLVGRTKQLVFDRYPQHFLEYAPRGELLAERGMVVEGKQQEPAVILGRDSPSPSTNSEIGLNRARAGESFTWLLLCCLGLSSIIQGMIDSSLIQFMLFLLGGDRAHILQRIALRLLLALGLIGFPFRLWKRLPRLVEIQPSYSAAIDLVAPLPMVTMTFFAWPVSPLLGRLAAFAAASWILRRRLDWKIFGYALLAICGFSLVNAALSTLFSFSFSFVIRKYV